MRNRLKRREVSPERKMQLALEERARVRAASDAERIILPPDIELEEVCRQVVQDTSADSAFITVVTNDAQVVKASWGLDPNIARTGERIPLPYSVCSYVVAHDAPRVIPSVRQDRELRNCLADVGAYIGVPIHHRRQPIGALGGLGPDGHEWTDNDLFAVGSLARWVEMSIRLRSGDEPTGSPVTRT